MIQVNFLARNPMYAIKNVRSLPAVVRAMNKYRKEHPRCAWCGRPGIEVHHIKPVHLYPELAAEPTNFISLNRKPACHHVIGHRGSWKEYNLFVHAVCGEVGAE